MIGMTGTTYGRLLFDNVLRSRLGPLASFAIVFALSR